MEERIISLERQAGSTGPPDLLRGSFAKQRAFVEDDATRFGYVFCTRRAAKSYSAALKAYRRALKSKCNVLIAGLARDEVKRIFWHPIVQDIADRYDVPGVIFNETELSVRFPNGSWIYLLGMDADEKQKRKALGQKWALVVIDEAQDWVTDLNELVFGVLKPACADQRGAIWLLGTPGLVARGLFYEVCAGIEPGWVRHEWTTEENTTQPDASLPPINVQWSQEIADLKARKPGVEKTPWFRRNYLREWVVDESALVYRYQAGRNDYDGTLPTYRLGSWSYVLGCDLGWNATALSVCAYHDHDPALYILRSKRWQGLDITATAEQAKALNRVTEFSSWVIDGANKQAVEEMRKRQDIPWRAADKLGKADFIELMNTEMLVGMIKVNPAECGDLVGEWGSLIWDQDKLRKLGKKEEKAGLPNHCADATLYPWRFCYPYLSTAHPVAAPAPGSQAWYAAQQAHAAKEGERMEREFEEALERKKREQDEAWQAEREAEMYG